MKPGIRPPSRENGLFDDDGTLRFFLQSSLLSLKTTPMTSQPVPELEDELARFRREWQEETKRRGTASTAAPGPSEPSTSTRPPQPRTSNEATSPRSKRKSLEPVDHLQQQLEGTRLDGQAPVDREKERPQSALDLYSEAVRSEQEGRLNDGELPPSREQPVSAINSN